jgi:hypothetical protein
MIAIVHASLSDSTIHSQKAIAIFDRRRDRFRVVVNALTSMTVCPGPAIKVLSTAFFSFSF